MYNYRICEDYTQIKIENKYKKDVKDVNKQTTQKYLTNGEKKSI